MTAPICGTSVSFHSPDEIDSPPEQPAVAPPPPRPNGSAANQVGAWSGTAPQLGDSGDRAPSGFTAGQLARGAMPTLSADFVNTGVDALMGRTFPSADDARHAVSMLEQLPPREYRLALESMHGQTLKTLFGTMDESTKAAFFAQARQKGAIAEEPGARLPPLVGSPPDKPALLRNEQALRPELREAIHAENKARARDYMQQFDLYTERYANAALAAPNPMVLRSMGPPVGEFALYEPGLVGERDNKQFKTLDQGVATSRARAARAVNDRISDFAGRTRAGAFSGVASARVTLEAGPVELQLKREDKLSDSGKRQTSRAGEALVELAPGASAGFDEQGRAVEQLKAGSFKAKFEGGQATTLEGKAAGFGLRLDEGKTTLSAKVPGAPIGAYATVDEKKGSFGGGFKASEEAEIHGLGKLEVEVKLGFEAQGIAPERLGDIASMKAGGIWGPMPELSGSGTRWTEIPAARQAELQRQCGFNRSNWPVK